jgi:uncharacterized membrane protein
MRIIIIDSSTNEDSVMKKTVTFAMMHFSIAFFVAWALTGSVVIGGAVALVEPAVNTVAFYFHEKIWNRLGSRKTGTDSLQSLAA